MPDPSYLIILIAVLFISPFVLKLASNQKKETKQQLKWILLFILSAQILLGFLKWTKTGIFLRSGFEIANSFPGSLLVLFFIISALQILLILLNTERTNLLAAILNFINTVLIFVAMIRLSNILGYQVVNIAPVSTVFLVLIGNIFALVFINKDKNLLKKYFRP